MSKHAIIFDTHRFVSRLIETGMAQSTAEALADEQIRLIESNLATKNDIEELRAATKHDIAEIHQKIENLRAETKHDIAEVNQQIETLRSETKHGIENLRSQMHQKLAEIKADLIKWMAGLLIALLVVQSGVFVALIKLI